MRATAGMNATSAESAATAAPAMSGAAVQADFPQTVDTSNVVAKNRSSARDAVSTLHWAVGIVVVSLVLLWILGGIVFRNANI